MRKPSVTLPGNTAGANWHQHRRGSASLMCQAGRNHLLYGSFGSVTQQCRLYSSRSHLALEPASHWHKYCPLQPHVLRHSSRTRRKLSRKGRA